MPSVGGDREQLEPMHASGAGAHWSHALQSLAVPAKLVQVTSDTAIWILGIYPTENKVTRDVLTASLSQQQVTWIKSSARQPKNGKMKFLHVYTTENYAAVRKT